MVKECLEPRCCFSNFVWDFLMFAETKHLRTFFEKLSCIKTALYYHISSEIYSNSFRGLLQDSFLSDLLPKITTKCPKTKQGINQYSDASQKVIFHNIKPKLSELRTVFLLIPNM